MKSPKTTGKRKILKLLESLQQSRENDEYHEDFPQTISAPQAIGRGIPTLKRGVYRQPTPMIQSRFEYCSTWKNPSIGLEWLSVKQMKACLSDEQVMHSIMTRKDFWEGSAPATHDWMYLSLFAIDREEKSEVYLVWDMEQQIEPQLLRYIDQHKNIFRNLQHYLEYLNGVGRI